MVFFLTLILGCQLIGELAVAAIGLPLPGPVLGMVLLFAGLCIGGLPDDLARVGDTLLANLSLLFVPAGVGVMLHAGLLGRDWLPLLGALVGSTLVTVLVTGMVMARLGRGASGAGAGEQARDDDGDSLAGPR
ncbi:MAG: CidA/LrgA family protein [Pseudomonadota bacterium]